MVSLSTCHLGLCLDDNLVKCGVDKMHLSVPGTYCPCVSTAVNGCRSKRYVLIQHGILSLGLFKALYTSPPGRPYTSPPGRPYTSPPGRPYTSPPGRPYTSLFGVLRSYLVGSPKKANSNLYEGVQVSYIGLLKHAAVQMFNFSNNAN